MRVQQMGILSLSQFGLRLTAPIASKDSKQALPDRGIQDLFNVKLESRLDNYRRGISGSEDSAVDVEISNRSASVSESLATSDPKALQNYNSLLSGLTYSRSARVVTNVEFAVRKLSQIPSKEEAQAQTDEILKAFNLQK